MIEQLKTSGFWYLASPYTHPDPEIRHIRALEANTFSGAFLARGVHVYSPIWATHRANLCHELPTDHVFWLAFNKAFIDPADGIIVCDIDGWQQSKGCQQEIQYARECGKPVWLCDNTLTLSAL